MSAVKDGNAKERACRMQRTHVGDDRVSGAQQFVACVVKHVHEKRRDVITSLLEFWLPPLFIIGSIILWSVFSSGTVASRQFVDYGAPGDLAQASTSFGTMRSTLCVNETVNPSGINGFAACNASAAVTCFARHRLVPVHGLCTSDIGGVTAFMVFLAGGPSESLIYPLGLDDIILAQWLTKFVGIEEDGTNSNTPKAALTNSGRLRFAPNTTRTHDVVTYFNSTSALFRYAFGGVFGTPADAARAVVNQDEEGTNWGIVNIMNMTSLDYNVEIRLNHSSMPETQQIINKNYLGGVDEKNVLYVLSGFYTIEWLLGKYYLEEVVSVPFSVVPPMVAPMGFATYDKQTFLAFSGTIIPLLIVLGFLYPVSQLAKRIVMEKELRIREAMFIMGLTNVPFYGAWIAVHAAQHVVTALLISMLLKVTYLTRADFGVLFFTFFLFEMSTIALCGLVSSLFSKARLAALVTPLVYFATAIPLFVLEGASGSTKRGMFVLSPTAFAGAIQLIFQRELGGGLGSKDVTDKNDDPAIIVIFLMLAMDTLLYFVLWLWADAVVPNDWGTPRSCFFWATEPARAVARWVRGVPEESAAEDLPDGRSPQGVYEEAPVDDKTTVELVGLRKVFTRGSKPFVAVNNLYWQLREGEISVLLGHNGAGKTTTMNLMTGMLEADGGDCYVYGYSVRHELSMVRREIGFCPQHNILWPDLTCEEHLRFYGAIKGVTGEALDAAVTSILGSVDLGDKRDYCASALSGGQKRKLSVAIAFVGGSRLIFLDEPTAGMDVGARRHMWGLLQQMASTHTILLSTHFMDEADLLGHSIGIMSSGALQCSGSSLFLKSRLGVGYSIVLGVEQHVNRQTVDQAMRRHVAEAALLGAGPGEITYRLPASAAGRFPALLSMLECDGASIGIRNFSISATTLEEIFLQLAHGAEELHRVRQGDVGAVANASVASPSAVDVRGVASDFSAQSEVEMNTIHVVSKKGRSAVWNVRRLEPGSAELAMTQMKAMLTKRLNNSMRDRRTQCLQVVLPIACLLLAMILTLISFFSTPELVISSALYKETTITDLQGCAGLFDQSISIPGTILREPSGLANALNLSEYLRATANSHGDLPRYGAISCEDAELGAALGGAAAQSVVFFNSSSYHELPIGVYNYFNSIYRKSMGPLSSAMRLVSNPMPKTAREEAFESSIRSMMIGIIIMIPFTFIPSTFVAWVVKERECKARHLQSVSGLGFGVYWVSNFLFDTASFLVTMTLAIVVFAIFGRTEYVGADAIGATILLLFFYGLAGVAFAYLVSFLFTEHSTAQNIVMLVNFITGFLLVIVVFILSIVDSTKDVSKVLAYIFRIVPSYALGDGIINLAILPMNRAFGSDDTQWTMSVAGADILYMALECPIALLIVFFIDHPRRRMKMQALLHDPDAAPEVILGEDEDVARERREVENTAASGRAGDLVVVKNMRKAYSNGKVAVRNLSFGVHPGEVFGFLGTNGAGKTTTISMLCQEFFPSSGHGYIAGYDIVNAAEDALRCIGYCPQFDALLDLLTVEEHLWMYAGVRGIVAEDRGTIVQELADLCELTQYMQSVSSELSGGNKRKLSVALSLLGGPRVVFLDEPSAGMDPVARRGLWTAIETVADNCSVVLTTHHLEEVEALAHRVGIMVDGTLRCIGDKLHLKTKYGSGFELSMKVASKDRCGLMEEFVRVNIPAAKLSESHGLRYTYELPQDTRLSTMFSLLEDSKGVLGVTDYSVSQTSIEQVFLRISAEAEAARNGLRYTYELPQDTRLSTMFSLLEDSKGVLGVTDYSVSQTSIEQVFLRISAEAEAARMLQECLQSSPPRESIL
ncbi:ABC transporter, putative [Bodo saltans]|uniref:ABC transporter, putative n=1 Tax=Bodo saltans TaxID=75058 RepID=A0A0S4J5Z1_BODSA|nr:ABC transporter, putative [Bodo saltans]|eukprot:CUG36520.1 ABC transporter, putative [Bodo saltans]